MNDALRQWWKARSVREQRLLLALGLVALVVFVWLLVVRPLGDALSGARERHGEAVLALAEARARAALIAEAESGATAPLGMPLDAMLNQSALEAGFTGTRVEREGAARATVVIPAARPQAAFGWLSRMAARGLVVVQASVAPNSDQTVRLEATFRTRGL
ncbi:MAG: type II secretion system protein GspM [Sphingomonadaceae bacterium]